MYGFQWTLEVEERQAPTGEIWRRMRYAGGIPGLAAFGPFGALGSLGAPSMGSLSIGAPPRMALTQGASGSRKRLKYPHYETDSARLKSLKKWTSNSNQSKTLAKMGYFYDDDDDEIKCYRCGEGHDAEDVTNGLMRSGGYGDLYHDCE